MVGSSICRRLANDDVDLLVANRNELDLTDYRAVTSYFAEHKPTTVVFAAAKVGGILANRDYPVDFLSENASMALATIRAAHEASIERFLFLGSTCIYPRESPQPIAEESLLSGPLEPTNEAYALAKIVGLKLCEYYRRQHGSLFYSAMPTNLYGPGDNYHPWNSHVLPALIARFHEAKEAGAPSVTIWGTGTPKREFLFVDDLADAVVHLLAAEDPPSWVNVGTGHAVSIMEAAKQVANTVGFQGEILTDTDKPDGTPVKVSNVEKLKSMGWQASTSLEQGLVSTYAAFLKERENGTLRSQ